MDFENIRQSLGELSPEDQQLLYVLSVVCEEGASVYVLRTVLQSDDDSTFYVALHHFLQQWWLICDHDVIISCHEVSEIVMETIALDPSTVLKVLSGLRKRTYLTPFDDMLARREYFVVARLFLTHLYNNWKVQYSTSLLILCQFSETVISFASNVELSFYKVRKPVLFLEDRIDFKLLTFIKESGVKEATVNRLLGDLYSAAFRYEEAKKCFERTEHLIGTDASLLLSRAKMYLNLGQMAMACRCAYQAYQINNSNEEYTANIQVCLLIAMLCAYSDDYPDARRWMKKVRQLLGNRVLPACHPISIAMKEIEAFTQSDNYALACQIADAAELQLLRLYGGGAPQLAYIFFIRYVIEMKRGTMRRADELYYEYVCCNHANRGLAVGDLAIYYSEMVSQNLRRGSATTAYLYTNRLSDLCSGSDYLAPHVRLSHCFSCFFSYLTAYDFERCKEYSEKTRAIFADEIMPDDDTLRYIAPMFKDGKIPGGVLMSEYLWTIKYMEYCICIEEGRTGDAIQLARHFMSCEVDEHYRRSWYMYLAVAIIRDGKQDNGLAMLRDIVDKTPAKEKFDVIKDIAERVTNIGLFPVAMHLYEEALQADVMVYGKTCDIAGALQGYADVLDSCGMTQQSDQPWKEALMLFQSIGDDDSTALLYLSWAKTQQDHTAEVLLKKAIETWKPERDTCDETLAVIYYHLCQEQAVQGKIDEARRSAAKVVELFPTDLPPEMLEDIEDYL